MLLDNKIMMMITSFFSPRPDRFEDVCIKVGIVNFSPSLYSMFVVSSALGYLQLFLPSFLPLLCPLLAFCAISSLLLLENPLRTMKESATFFCPTNWLRRRGGGIESMACVGKEEEEDAKAGQAGPRPWVRNCYGTKGQWENKRLIL